MVYYGVSLQTEFIYKLLLHKENILKSPTLQVRKKSNLKSFPCLKFYNDYFFLVIINSLIMFVNPDKVLVLSMLSGFRV